jgi:Icc-related predicted phosphoesterase
LVDPKLEMEFQQEWLQRHGALLVKDLKAPLLLVRGNHDFISPTDSLRKAGATVMELSDDTPVISFGGLLFGGFRQIPFIVGEWAGEEHDMDPVIKRVMRHRPQVLVTHTPPAQILCDGYGCTSLTSALFYGKNRVRTHLFGHAHLSTGVVQTGGKIFSNAACSYHSLVLNEQGETVQVEDKLL